MRRFQLYDTLSRETRLFVPITPPKVGLFVCGMTPYDDAHIGHGKIGVTFDVVARALRHWGYRVFYVQNVTNIDDRLIQKGGETGTDPLVLADRHFFSWRLAMDDLGVRSVNYYPHATDYMPEILEQIQQLIDRGLAYISRGSVYFEVSKFPEYGKLSGQRTEALRPGARLEVDKAKKAPEDFVLWKASTPGEPWWEAPWGPGRPGWHIEDTAITVRLLGARYDIHGGGLDLKFPHHEAEIAQAEGATGKVPLVNYWMHMGLLNMRGEKMSKSLGNVVGLREAIDRHGAEVLRFYYLNAHYRSPLDYAEGKSLEEASEAYDRLTQVYRRLARSLDAAGPERAGKELPEEVAQKASDTVEGLDAALSDDFNTRAAIAELFVWSRTVLEWEADFPNLSTTALEALAGPYRWAQEVLGLCASPSAGSAVGAELDGAVQVAIAARARARESGDYAEADRIRDELRAAGIILEDNAGTTRWERARRAS